MSSEPLSRQEPHAPDAAWKFQDEVYQAESAPLPGYRPGGLTAVCVIAIVLGVLGGLTGFTGALMNLFGSQVQQFQQQFAGGAGPPDAVRLQIEMNQRTAEIVNRYRLVNLTFSAIQIWLAVALVVGGILALLMRERGRRLLWIACGAAIFFELARAVPYVMMQMENMSLMEEYMPRLMEASAPGAQGEQMAAFGRMFARFSTIMGWIIFFGWLILKLAYFGVGFRYLSRPSVRALYSSDTKASAV